MRKAKRLVLLSLMVFLLSSLNACGTDNKNPDDMAQNETPSGTENGAGGSVSGTTENDAVIGNDNIGGSASDTLENGNNTLTGSDTITGNDTVTGNNAGLSGNEANGSGGSVAGDLINDVTTGVEDLVDDAADGARTITNDLTNNTSARTR